MRSPTRTTRPPSRLGSTWTSSSMRPPVNASEPLGQGADLVLGQRGGADGGGDGDALAGVVEPPEFGGESRQLVDPAAPQHQPDQVEHGLADRRPEDATWPSRPRCSSGSAGWPASGRRARRPRSPRPCRARSATPRRCRRAWPPRRRPLRSGVQPSLRRAISSSRPRRRTVSRNSSTSRRWRSSVIVSPTTLLAASRARSATSARTSWMARVFSASISPAARTRRRSSSSRVAAMSASRVSWATFWARARISFDSRRASASVATRSCFRVLPIAPGLLGVLQALLDLGLAVAEHARHGLERERPDDHEEQDEVERADDHPEQVDLEQRGFTLGGEQLRRDGPPSWRRPGYPRRTRPAG